MTIETDIVSTKCLAVPLIDATITNIAGRYLGIPTSHLRSQIHVKGSLIKNDGRHHGCSCNISK